MLPGLLELQLTVSEYNGIVAVHGGSLERKGKW